MISQIPHYHKITIAALLTRIAGLLLILLSTLVVPKHIPYGVHLFQSNESSFFTDAFTKWDSAYFLEIARDGYIDPQMFAFFPLYPILIRFVAQGLSIVASQISADTILCISALLISNMAFIVSCHILYKLLLRFATKEIALRAVFIYMINPATIFFITAYSESVFAMLTFSAILHHTNKHHLQASICFFGASLTRSNGLFSLIFGFYPLGQYLVTIFMSTAAAVPAITSLFPYTILAVPYVFHNYFIHASLCTASSSLCELPFYSSYSALQEQYWGVGWLRRFQFRQIPNFLLATPMCICVSICVFTLLPMLWNCTRNSIYLAVNSSAAPHVVHMIVLAVVCIFIAHVQIVTRIIASSCPLIYLVLAKQWDSPAGRWIAVYVGVYFVAGLVLHPNHYPWT